MWTKRRAGLTVAPIHLGARLVFLAQAPTSFIERVAVDGPAAREVAPEIALGIELDKVRHGRGRGRIFIAAARSVEDDQIEGTILQPGIP